MTQIAALVRRAVVLLLAVGVLVMHASNPEPVTQASPSTAMAAMAGHGFAHDVMVAAEPGPAVTRTQGPVRPAGCAGGTVCRAGLGAPTKHLLPPSASLVSGEATHPGCTAATSSRDAGTDRPPPTRARLQVWRC